MILILLLRKKQYNLIRSWWTTILMLLLKIEQLQNNNIQSDLTYPHTSVLNEFADKVRELDKWGCGIVHTFLQVSPLFLACKCTIPMEIQINQSIKATNKNNHKYAVQWNPLSTKFEGPLSNFMLKEFCVKRSWLLKQSIWLSVAYTILFFYWGKILDMASHQWVTLSQCMQIQTLKLLLYGLSTLVCIELSQFLTFHIVIYG